MTKDDVWLTVILKMVETRAIRDSWKKSNEDYLDTSTIISSSIARLVRIPFTNHAFGASE